jgi:hypothetical protein
MNTKPLMSETTMLYLWEEVMRKLDYYQDTLCTCDTCWTVRMEIAALARSMQRLIRGYLGCRPGIQYATRRRRWRTRLRKLNHSVARNVETWTDLHVARWYL